VGGKKNEADGLLRVLRVSAKTKQTKKLVFFKLREIFFLFYKTSYAIFFNFGHTKNQTQPTSLLA
jgi:hypothetical protein